MRPVRFLFLFLCVAFGCNKNIVMDMTLLDNPYQGKTAAISMGKDIQIVMVWLESGTFIMGSPDNETGRSDDEGPASQVYLDGFWIAQTPITQAQYQAVMNRNPSRFKGSNRPVEQVSWYEAMEFCSRLSDMTGLDFTLPTEAQWEYACRAGTQTPFAFGICLNTEYANYNGHQPLEECPQGEFRRSTWPVHSGRANAWDLYDMHANIWEWCLDWYDESYYSIRPDTNPTGPDHGTWRVLRGGSFNTEAMSCRSANRGFSYPDSRVYLGFRVVLSVN